ncbi:MAG: hypothetical protein CMH31_01965 [Micavibrio sp.]|nr:hypothetical protein [Micavibrio sp.]|tara:strand:+ start:141 stop:590 length:450 start_codon:yes stop_codon:yes gene_type:complete
MSNDFSNVGSLLTPFVGAARDLQREINGAYTRTKTALNKEGIFGLSESSLEVLRLILEFSDQCSSPLEIAEQGIMDKGAFNRCLTSLEENEHVTLEQKDNKITSVALTDEGRSIAALFQEKLEQELEKLLESKGLERLAGLHTQYQSPA